MNELQNTLILIRDTFMQESKNAINRFNINPSFGNVVNENDLQQTNKLLQSFRLDFPNECQQIDSWYIEVRKSQREEQKDNINLPESLNVITNIPLLNIP